MGYGLDGYDKTGCMGEEDVKKDTWTSLRARNMGKKI